MTPDAERPPHAATGDRPNQLGEATQDSTSSDWQRRVDALKAKARQHTPTPRDITEPTPRPEPDAPRQPHLFTSAPDLGTARKADPATSRDAARSIRVALGAMQGEVLDALVGFGGEGVLDDVVIATGRQKGTTSRRLADLEQGGYIEKTGETRPGHLTGRAQCVWRVIADG